MKQQKAAIWMTIAAMFFAFVAVSHALDWEVQRSMKIQDTPIDIATSLNKRYVYVLTDTGLIFVYEPGGRLVDTADVGNHVDAISPGPTDDTLFISSRSQKSAQFITLEFIRNFDLAGSPSKGPENAPVVIVEFSEFECGYCARLAPILQKIHEAFPEKVRIVFKNFPLSSHKNSKDAALAALAADKQGQFWAYHDKLFQNQKGLSKQLYRQIASELGLDLDQFEADIKNPATLNQIRRDFQAGMQAGVRGVPATYLNGKLLRNRTFETIKADIEKALAELSDKKSD